MTDFCQIMSCTWKKEEDSEFIVLIITLCFRTVHKLWNHGTVKYTLIDDVLHCTVLTLRSQMLSFREH